MKKNNLLGKEKNVLATILIISTIVLGGLQFISYTVHEKAFMGDETYYYMRMSGQYQDTGVANYDLLKERSVSFNLLYLVPGTPAMPLEPTARFLPVILGVISVYLFYVLTKIFKLDKDERLASTIIFAANPLFVYVFTSFTPLILAVPIGLAGTIFLFRKKFVLATAFFAVLPLLSFTPSLLAFACLLALLFLRKDMKAAVAASISAIVVATIASWLFLGFSPDLELAPSQELLSSVFVELGGIKAYSIIIIALATMGIIATWKRDINSLYLLLITIISLIASLFFSEIRIFVTIIISVFAGIGIINIARMEWNVQPIKNITLILVLCSIIFSFVVSIDNAFSQVNAEKINGMRYLSTSDPEDIILSVEENGFMISYLAGRRPFIDGFSYKYEYYDERKEEAMSIYYLRDLASLEEKLQENNINYILLDYNMRHGGVWTSSEEGILFLFKYANEFVRIFNNEEVMIYRYIG